MDHLIIIIHILNVSLILHSVKQNILITNDNLYMSVILLFIICIIHCLLSHNMMLSSMVSSYFYLILVARHHARQVLVNLYDFYMHLRSGLVFYEWNPIYG
jgi:hypothetical protein